MNISSYLSAFHCILHQWVELVVWIVGVGDILLKIVFCKVGSEHRQWCKKGSWLRHLFMTSLRSNDLNSCSFYFLWHNTIQFTIVKNSWKVSTKDYLQNTFQSEEEGTFGVTSFKKKLITLNICLKFKLKQEILCSNANVLIAKPTFIK